MLMFGCRSLTEEVVVASISVDLAEQGIPSDDLRKDLQV